MSRTLARTLLFALALAGLPLAPACAQRRAGFSMPRVWLSAWAGRFVDFGGFSDDQNTFFQFDDATAFGGSVHVRPGQLAQLGIDVVWSRPAYQRFDRETVEVMSSGEATTLAALASLRLAGGGGPLGLYLTGAAGAFIWNLEELGGRETDPAATIGIGVDYALPANAMLFGEYGQWWVFHQKDDTVEKNTAKHTLFRFGLRYGF
jgi:hypothetical protein